MGKQTTSGKYIPWITQKYFWKRSYWSVLPLGQGPQDSGVTFYIFLKMLHPPTQPCSEESSFGPESLCRGVWWSSENIGWSNWPQNPTWDLALNQTQKISSVAQDQSAFFSSREASGGAKRQALGLEDQRLLQGDVGQRWTANLQGLLSLVGPACFKTCFLH